MKYSEAMAQDPVGKEILENTPDHVIDKFDQDFERKGFTDFHEVIGELNTINYLPYEDFFNEFLPNNEFELPITDWDLFESWQDLYPLCREECGMQSLVFYNGNIYYI